MSDKVRVEVGAHLLGPRRLARVRSLRPLEDVGLCDGLQPCLIPRFLAGQALAQYEQVRDDVGVWERTRWQPRGGDEVSLLIEMSADRLRCWRIECVARSDEGEDSARPEFGQRFDEEVGVDRAREKPLAGFEVGAIDDWEVAERHVRDGNVEGVVAERRVLKAGAVDGGPRVQLFEKAGSYGVQLSCGADRPGRCLLGLQAQEAPDARCRFQDPRSRKIAE